MRGNTVRAATMALVLVLLLSCAGCVGININSGDRNNTVHAEGPLTEMSFAGGQYSAVTASGAFDVVYVSEASPVVKVEMQENLLQYMFVEVKDGKLTVRAEREFSYGSDDVGKVYVYAPHLERLTVNGMVNVAGDKVTGDSLLLDVAGMSGIDLDIEVDRLRVIAYGMSGVDLRGSASSAEFDIAGMTSLSAAELQLREAVVEMAGQSNGEIACSETLEADIAGMSSLVYRGDASVQSSVSGMSSIERAN